MGNHANEIIDLIKRRRRERSEPEASKPRKRDLFAVASNAACKRNSNVRS